MRFIFGSFSFHGLQPSPAPAQRIGSDGIFSLPSRPDWLQSFLRRSHNRTWDISLESLSKPIRPNSIFFDKSEVDQFRFPVFSKKKKVAWHDTISPTSTTNPTLFDFCVSSPGDHLGRSVLDFQNFSFHDFHNFHNILLTYDDYRSILEQFGPGSKSIIDLGNNLVALEVRSKDQIFFPPFFSDMLSTRELKNCSLFFCCSNPQIVNEIFPVHLNSYGSFSDVGIIHAHFIGPNYCDFWLNSLIIFFFHCFLLSFFLIISYHNRLRLGADRPILHFFARHGFSSQTRSIHPCDRSPREIDG